MQVLQKLRRMFRDPLEGLKALLPDLSALKQELSSFLNVPDGVVAIVPFFGVIARYNDAHYGDAPSGHNFWRVHRVHDELGMRGASYAGIVEALDLLDKHFGNAGRALYGWNRTRRGEGVTEDNVYLGNIYGLFTKTVRFWKAYKGEPKGSWEGTIFESEYTRTRNSYDIVSDQARGFIESHVGPMIELITQLERAAAS